MYSIKFQDENGNKFTYTTFTNVRDKNDALEKYNWYISKRFNNSCELLEIKKII